MCSIRIVGADELSTQWAMLGEQGVTTLLLPTSTRVTPAMQLDVCEACRRLGGACVPAQRAAALV